MAEIASGRMIFCSRLSSGRLISRRFALLGGRPCWRKESVNCTEGGSGSTPEISRGLCVIFWLCSHQRRSPRLSQSLQWMIAAAPQCERLGALHDQPCLQKMMMAVLTSAEPVPHVPTSLLCRPVLQAATRRQRWPPRGACGQTQGPLENRS